jgi:CRISPR/Cas system-associated endonuclease Cas3-HD
VCYNIYNERETPKNEREKKMKAIEIKEILKGKFTDEKDRQYWVEKLAEAERKEANVKENEKYFKAMKKYAR